MPTRKDLPGDSSHDVWIYKDQYNQKDTETNVHTFYDYRNNQSDATLNDDKFGTIKVNPREGMTGSIRPDDPEYNKKP